MAELSDVLHLWATDERAETCSFLFPLFANKTLSIMEAIIMNDFRVKIVENSGDISIYTNATSIAINGERIVVKYEDQKETHLVDLTDEITIEKNS